MFYHMGALCFFPTRQGHLRYAKKIPTDIGTKDAIMKAFKAESTR